MQHLSTHLRRSRATVVLDLRSICSSSRICTFVQQSSRSRITFLLRLLAATATAAAPALALGLDICLGLTFGVLRQLAKKDADLEEAFGKIAAMEKLLEAERVEKERNFRVLQVSYCLLPAAAAAAAAEDARTWFRCGSSRVLCPMCMGFSTCLCIAGHHDRAKVPRRREGNAPASCPCMSCTCHCFVLVPVRCVCLV